MMPVKTYQNPVAMLCDFGIVRKLADSELCQTAVGTPYYMSPQICKGEPYSTKTDIFSLGVVLYRCCTLKYPFYGANVIMLKTKIITGKYEPISGEYCEELKSIIYSMLEQDEAKRPTALELLKKPIFRSRLRHYKIDLSALEKKTNECVEEELTDDEEKWSTVIKSGDALL